MSQLKNGRLNREFFKNENEISQLKNKKTKNTYLKKIWEETLYFNLLFTYIVRF